jgi:hypothetical protein
MSDGQDQRRQTEAQVQAIETEIRENQPLCANRSDIATLKQLYERGSNFINAVDYLESCYAGIRSVRGDGNCYYRAFLYSLCEHLKKDPVERNRVLELGESSLTMACDNGDIIIQPKTVQIYNPPPSPF